jgi:hypothetical protein
VSSSGRNVIVSAIRTSVRQSVRHVGKPHRSRRRCQSGSARPDHHPAALPRVGPWM